MTWHGLKFVCVCKQARSGGGEGWGCAEGGRKRKMVKQQQKILIENNRFWEALGGNFVSNIVIIFENEQNSNKPTTIHRKGGAVILCTVHGEAYIKGVQLPSRLTGVLSLPRCHP